MKIKISIIWATVIAVLASCSSLNAKEITAFEYTEEQLAFGARHPGTEGHNQTVDLIANTLLENDWEVSIQYSRQNRQPCFNVVGKKNWDEYILLGAHYDTREFADSDPDMENQIKPVPGANDGASGTSVLLDLTNEPLDSNVRLAFFDQEDQGRIENYSWVHGSEMYVRTNAFLPESAVILDMIGDADLKIYYEGTSNSEINQEIWAAADEMGHGDVFIPEIRHFMIDDHSAFLKRGIPAAVLIDFDYPYWHTVQDVLENVNQHSLEIVKNVILDWLAQP